MYRTAITKTSRIHDFPSVWAPEHFGRQKSDPRGVPGMYILIPNTYRFHDFPYVWALEPFRSQKSDPRGVAEMYGILITKKYRFHYVPPVWAPSQKSDPRGVPEMYRTAITKPIDSIIFLPFGLWRLIGAKNRIREGCQKCLGL